MHRSTNLFTTGAISRIDMKTIGHPSKKDSGHFFQNISNDGALINVIAPLTIKLVLNDITTAKTRDLY